MWDVNCDAMRNVNREVVSLILVLFAVSVIPAGCAACRPSVEGLSRLSEVSAVYLRPMKFCSGLMT